MSMRRHLYSYWRTCCQNIMRSYCYRQCTYSISSKNWMAMMNQNYQAEKLLKRLQNNPIKNHVTFQKVPKSTHVAFSFWFLHSSVIVLADALPQACGSVPERRCLFCVTNGGHKDSTIWNSILKSWQQQDHHHSLTGKGNQVKSHSQLYALFFKW